MMQTIGFYQMQISALQTCGRRIVSFCRCSSYFYVFFKINFFQKLNSLISTAAGVEWNDVNMLHEELEMAGISTPRAHIPSSGVADVHPVDNVQPR